MISFYIYIISLLFISSTNATDIKWIPAEGNNPDASQVPRRYSQKYWDENNIKRPDYAKTDEEVHTIENGTGSNSNHIGNIFLVLVVSLVIYKIIEWKKGGSRLGSGNTRTKSIFSLFGWNSKPQLSLEEERRLRLARFEADEDDVTENADSNRTKVN